MTEQKSLFHGIAVLIDDEVNDADSEIEQLAKQIEADDCHVVRISELPSDAKLATLTEASFFILDWNLHHIHSEAGLEGNLPLLQRPSRLAVSHIKANIDFLKKIRESRFAPIFIFTNENTESVKESLLREGLFGDSPSDHIFILGKKDVLKSGVFKILDEWIKGHPSAYVLKRWEMAYAQTRNTFFVDFYLYSHLWPVVLWQAYNDDHVSESAELTSMISRNIISRLAPVPFDSDIVAAHRYADVIAEEVSPEQIRKVLEGERFIRNERLQEEVSVGDVFKHQGKYFVNVRPECDCVVRNGSNLDDIELYLIRGDKVTDKQLHENFDSTFGNFVDRDTSGTVFAMHDGITVRFQFRDLKVEKWGVWKSRRIGRLIPPYSTKLQQRFGSFIQRIGLARIPLQAVPPREDNVDVDRIENAAHSRIDNYSVKDHLKALLSKSVRGLLRIK